jgi:hypothetical protein
MCAALLNKINDAEPLEDGKTHTLTKITGHSKKV